jgi:hypothetical protein
MKQKYIVTEEREVIARWTFEVEAESYEDALRMVMSGEVDLSDHNIWDDNRTLSEYDVKLKEI